MRRRLPWRTGATLRVARSRRGLVRHRGGLCSGGWFGNAPISGRNLKGTDLATNDGVLVE
jgi:hypothetical protein